MALSVFLIILSPVAFNFFEELGGKIQGRLNACVDVGFLSGCSLASPSSPGLFYQYFQKGAWPPHVALAIPISSLVKSHYQRICQKLTRDSHTSSSGHSCIMAGPCSFQHQQSWHCSKNSPMSDFLHPPVIVKLHFLKKQQLYIKPYSNPRLIRWRAMLFLSLVSILSQHNHLIPDK